MGRERNFGIKKEETVSRIFNLLNVTQAKENAMALTPGPRENHYPDSKLVYPY